MSGAYYEKIARINLSTGEIKAEKLDLAVAQKFIGGRGLGTKILYDEGVATVDPLSPDNKLVYITGPMTGSASPSSGRYMVVTKSPLTGMIACANSGGIWGAKLKFAGWDALIVEGVAPDWCYLNIEDDKIEGLPIKAQELSHGNRAHQHARAEPVYKVGHLVEDAADGHAAAFRGDVAPELSHLGLGAGLAEPLRDP